MCTGTPNPRQLTRTQQILSQACLGGRGVSWILVTDVVWVSGDRDVSWILVTDIDVF